MMDSFEKQETTQLIAQAKAGDSVAMVKLLPAIYSDLRRIARARLCSERHHTLGTIALVHEGWLAMQKSGVVDFSSRKHCFADAAKAMRSLLVDRARQRAAG